MQLNLVNFLHYSVIIINRNSVVECHKIWLLSRQPPLYSDRGEITDVVVVNKCVPEIGTVECHSSPSDHLHSGVVV